MKKILYLGIIITSIKMHAQITASVITSASCFSPCTGSATFIATGGVPPYSYSVFPNTYSVQSSNVFYGLCPISYSYAVCDALFNCTFGSFNIGIISPPSISNVTYAPASPPPFLYNATATISGGNHPYYVHWYQFNGINYVPIKTHTISFISMMQDTAYLYPGDYSVTVTDANNVSAGCGGGMGYMFSICDNGVGTGIITVSPSNTICTNNTFTVNYSPMLFGPVNIIGYNHFSSGSSCSPSNTMGPYETFTCSISSPTNIAFGGFWVYANGCPPISYPTASVSINVCTGIASHFDNRNISIYPNPSNGSFKIDFSKDEPVKIEIYDLMGKLLFQSVNKNNDEIHTHLNPGLYYIRCYLDNQIIERKIIISD